MSSGKRDEDEEEESKLAMTVLEADSNSISVAADIAYAEEKDEGVKEEEEEGDEDDKKVSARARHERDHRFSPDGSALPMTSEQRERKRLINRRSAQRKRQRERYQLETLTDQHSKLSQLNAVLAVDNDRLEKLAEKMKALMLLHNTVNRQQLQQSLGVGGSNTGVGLCGTEGSSLPISTAAKLQVLELLRSAVVDCMISIQPSQLVESWEPPHFPSVSVVPAEAEDNALSNGALENPLVRTTQFLKEKQEVLDAAKESVVQDSIREQEQAQRQLTQQPIMRQGTDVRLHGSQQQQQQQQPTTFATPTAAGMFLPSLFNTAASPDVPMASASDMNSLLVDEASHRFSGDEAAGAPSSAESRQLAVLERALMGALTLNASKHATNSNARPSQYIPNSATAGRRLSLNPLIPFSSLVGIPGTSLPAAAQSQARGSTPTSTGAVSGGSGEDNNDDQLRQLLAAVGIRRTPEMLQLLNLANLPLTTAGPTTTTRTASTTSSNSNNNTSTTLATPTHLLAMPPLQHISGTTVDNLTSSTSHAHILNRQDWNSTMRLVLASAAAPGADATAQPLLLGDHTTSQQQQQETKPPPRPTAAATGRVTPVASMEQHFSELLSHLVSRQHTGATTTTAAAAAAATTTTDAPTATIVPTVDGAANLLSCINNNNDNRSISFGQLHPFTLQAPLLQQHQQQQAAQVTASSTPAMPPQMTVQQATEVLEALLRSTTPIMQQPPRDPPT